MGSGARVAAVLRTMATGRCTWVPPGRLRSSGTVSTPHSTRGSLGTPSGHETRPNTGVYREAWGVLAEGLAEAGMVWHVAIDRTKATTPMTAIAYQPFLCEVFPERSRPVISLLHSFRIRSPLAAPSSMSGLVQIRCL